MKNKRKYCRFLLLICLLALVMSGCRDRGTIYRLNRETQVFSEDPALGKADGNYGESGSPEASGVTAVDSGETGTKAGQGATGSQEEPAGDNGSSAEKGVNTASSSAAAEGGAYEQQDTQNRLIYVYVCGAVEQPGVYTLPGGSRVYEAVAAAGGLTAEADDRCLNQALLLEDGQQIIVYSREETAGALPIQPQNGSPAQVSEETGEGDRKVDLNHAGKEELMTLPGIGEARAEAILRYRQEHGPFGSIEEITQIEGIKEKAFAKIKDYIIV